MSHTVLYITEETKRRRNAAMQHLLHILAAEGPILSMLAIIGKNETVVIDEYIWQSK